MIRRPPRSTLFPSTTLFRSTVLVPCVVPKFAPAIVTELPTNPDVGFRLVMLGAGTALVKLTPLVATPPTLPTTLPVVSPAGTGAVILVALQLVGVAAIPLNVTVPVLSFPTQPYHYFSPSPPPPAPVQYFL